MTNQELVSDLRRLADFYEQHENFPTPYVVHVSITDCDYLEKLPGWIRALGRCEKEYTDDFVKITKRFGSVSLTLIPYRHTVCERIVTGTKLVTKLAPINPEMHEVQVEEAIVEWKCHPLLEEAKV